MFLLKGSDFNIVLNPFQKLFRSARACCEEFFSSLSNSVDLSSASALGFPDSLKVSLLFHRMEERIEGSRAQVYFEPVANLQVYFIAPARFRLQ